MNRWSFLYITQETQMRTRNIFSQIYFKIYENITDIKCHLGATAIVVSGGCWREFGVRKMGELLQYKENR